MQEELCKMKGVQDKKSMRKKIRQEIVCISSEKSFLKIEMHLQTY